MRQHFRCLVKNNTNEFKWLPDYLCILITVFSTGQLDNNFMKKNFPTSLFSDAAFSGRTWPLHTHGHAHAAAYAQRHKAAGGVLLTQAMQQRHKAARAGGTYRMAECDGPTAAVEPRVVWREAQLLGDSHGLCSKSLRKKRRKLFHRTCR